jgi:methyl-accepting chemotaxis protein
MKNLTIRFSLMASLGLFATMLVIGAALGIFTLQRSNAALSLEYSLSMDTQAINDVYKDTTRTRSAMVRAYTDQRENGKPTSASSALDAAATTQGRSVKALKVFVAQAPDAATDAQLRKELGDAATRLIGTLDRAIDALRHDDVAQYTTINVEQLTSQGAAFSSLLEKFQKQQTTLSEQLRTERASEYRMVLWLVAAGLVAALALVLATHIFLKRVVIAPIDEAVALLDRVAQGDLTAHVAAEGDNEIGRLMRGIASMQQSLTTMVSAVRNGAQSISTTVQEVARGNADLSARTEHQAGSLEETASSMEELTGTVQQTAGNAAQARALVHSTSTMATTGGAVMDKMVETMAAIDASSRRVVDIISVIDGIAFQTNILALNAAVVAARAGEQGRGFAVVAGEVRTLAQRSATAAKEIKDLINDSAEKVVSGSHLVKEAGDSMQSVVESVQRVSGIVVEIAEASREQSLGIEQVNQAIAAMDEVTQRNAALVEESAAAAEALHVEADNLLTTVSVFKLPQPGGRAPHTAAGRQTLDYRPAGLNATTSGA